MLDPKGNKSFVYLQDCGQHCHLVWWCRVPVSGQAPSTCLALGRTLTVPTLPTSTPLLHVVSRTGPAPEHWACSPTMCGC